LQLPFSLRNAQATFQRAIYIFLSGVKWKTCLFYLDDLSVLFSSRNDHPPHVADALTLLDDSGLSLKLKKCHFFCETVDYLGHVIRPGWLGVAEKNTAALPTAPYSRTQKDLRSFLGLCNVYRRFVQPFSTLSSPLNELFLKGYDSPSWVILIGNHRGIQCAARSLTISSNVSFTSFRRADVAGYRCFRRATWMFLITNAARW
jgi:hypothetical protein